MAVDFQKQIFKLQIQMTITMHISYNIMDEGRILQMNDENGVQFFNNIDLCCRCDCMTTTNVSAAASCAQKSTDVDLTVLTTVYLYAW